MVGIGFTECWYQVVMCWDLVTECWYQVTEHWYQVTECWYQVTMCWDQVTECLYQFTMCEGSIHCVLGSVHWVLVPVHRVLGSGHCVLGLGHWVLGPGHWVLGLGHWVMGSGHWVLVPDHYVLGPARGSQDCLTKGWVMTGELRCAGMTCWPQMVEPPLALCIEDFGLHLYPWRFSFIQEVGPHHLARDAGSTEAWSLNTSLFSPRLLPRDGFHCVLVPGHGPMDCPTKAWARTGRLQHGEIQIIPGEPAPHYAHFGQVVFQVLSTLFSKMITPDLEVTINQTTLWRSNLNYYCN